MERIRVVMADPVFSPGISKTAKVPVTVTPSGLACQLEVFLGPAPTTKAATSGLVSFTSTAAQQVVSAPVAMPAAGGAYHVYIDLYVLGTYLVGYVATEDVIIPTATISPITWE